MNFSHDTLLTVTLRLACSYTLAGVLTATPTGASALNSPQRPATISPVTSTANYKANTSHSLDHDPQTYLAMIGPAPLRFAEAEQPLPPEPVLPTAASSKKPAAGTADTGHQSPLAATDSRANSSTPTTENTDLNATLTPSSLKPVSILPDDTRQEIRAEDVLPFFQFPGAPDDGAVAVPPTASQPRGTTAPRSSATYQQR